MSDSLVSPGPGDAVRPVCACGAIFPEHDKAPACGPAPPIRSAPEHDACCVLAFSVALASSVTMTKRDPDVRPLRALRESATTAKLYGALAEARDRAEAVVKSSSVSLGPNSGYKYASADARVAVAREALSDSGVVVLPMDWRKRGPDPQGVYVLDRVLRVAHESGEFFDAEFLDWPILVGGIRDHAKALAGALTSSYGYYVRDLLMLPCADEDDLNAEPHQGRRSRRGERPPEEDTTPAAAVASTLTAKGKDIVARFDAIKRPGHLASCGTWWKLEVAEARDAYSDADVQAIEEALDRAAVRVAPAPAAAPDAPTPPAVDAPPTSPPGAKVDPKRPATRTSRGSLPGMETR